MTQKTPKEPQIPAAEMPTEPYQVTPVKEIFQEDLTPTESFAFGEDFDVTANDFPTKEQLEETHLIAISIPPGFSILNRFGPWFVVVSTVLAGMFLFFGDNQVAPFIHLAGAWAGSFEILGGGPFWYSLLIGLAFCWPMLRRTQGLGLLEKWLLRAALGSVVMSCLFFLAGCYGIPLSETLGKGGILWPTAFGIVFAVEWRRRVKRVTPVIRETWTVWQMILSLLVTQAVLLNFAAVPAPPLLYDVTEYHLGALADYGPSAMDRAPHYGPVMHNMYARFPFPIEALYHASYAPKMLNALAVLGCALLVYIWLERAGIRRAWRLLAAFIVMGHSIMLEVNTDAMIDAPVAFLLLAAVYALMLAAGLVDNISRPKIIPVGLMILSGALCTKYTIAQIYLLPITIFCLIPLTRMVRVEKHWEWLIVGIFLALLPPLIWFGKNLVWYGNPTEPFFNWLWRPADTLAVAREQYYIESHFPQSFLSTQYWLTLPKRIGMVGWPILAALVAYSIPANIFARRDGWRLALIVIVSLFLWNLVQMAQGRFLLPAILMAILTGTIAMHNTWYMMSRNVDFMFVRAAACALAVMMGCSSAALTATQWYRLAYNDWLTYAFEMGAGDTKTAIKGDGEFYKKNLGALGTVLAEAATTKALSMRTDNRLLMIYEARPWLWLHMMPKGWAEITYNTVFDHSELLQLAEGAKTPEEITQRLKDANITHVLVNNEELRRFAQQYARPRELREKGIPNPEEIAPLWHTVQEPEDFYAPFSRDPRWQSMRLPVIQWLREMRKKAVIVSGNPEMEIWLAPIDAE